MLHTIIRNGIRPLLAGSIFCAMVVSSPANAQVVSGSTPQKAIEIYGALTYLLKADETCTLMGLPMRTAAGLMQSRALTVAGQDVTAQDALVEKRLAEVRGDTPCGNFARDPLLVEASRLVRTDMVASQLAWAKLIETSGGECGSFLSATGLSATPAFPAADSASRDQALMRLMTEAATIIRTQFANDAALPVIEQASDQLSARLDSLVCQNREFSELVLDDLLSIDGMFGNAEHSALVQDSPWTALAAARIYKFMRDDGFMADAYLAVDYAMYAYRNARSNDAHTFALSNRSATWFNADTEEQLPAAQVIFGMLTDNRIAVAIKAFNNVADVQDALLISADTSFRLTDIGTYHVPFRDGVTEYKLLALDADDIPKVLEAETIRISVRHEDGSVGSLLELDFPKTASLKKAIAFATSPSPS